MWRQWGSPKRRKLCNNLRQKLQSPGANPLKFQSHNSHLSLQSTQKKTIPCLITWHYDLTACVVCGNSRNCNTDWIVGTFHCRLLLLSDGSFRNYSATINTICYMVVGSLDLLCGIVSRPWPWQKWNRGSIPGGTRYFPILQSVQTGSCVPQLTLLCG
jgi:hypothetical protein